MQRFTFTFILILFPLIGHAWNGAGHRLTASIAWQQISAFHQHAIHAALMHHPDYQRWAKAAKSEGAAEIFIEASTWPDDIRNDPRFHNGDHEAAITEQSDFFDTDRHKNWHYVDLDREGKVRSGELDQQIERLNQVLRWTTKNDKIAYALPWLIHLVGDIHQPLHVGRHGDEGGNQVEIENPFNKRLPFANLHVFWDDLPGPPWLRGKRLADYTSRLISSHSPPNMGKVHDWRNESHQLLDKAYPDTAGSLLPLVSESFYHQAKEIADKQIVAAGYRLGWLLDNIFQQRVSRETP